MLDKLSSPGGGVENARNRDQRSWVFLNCPKNTLLLTEKLKKYFPKSKTPKMPFNITVRLAKVKHNIIVDNSD